MKPSKLPWGPGVRDKRAVREVLDAPGVDRGLNTRPTSNVGLAIACHCTVSCIACDYKSRLEKIALILE